MKKNPKVSVIITTCNRPDLIGRAVNSVLNQTFQDFEIIVVDDGMEKRASNEIEKINDDRIIYISHEKNMGAPAARNTGIDEAKGEYIAFLDDDDEWFSEKLEKQVEIFNKHNDKIGLVSCALEVFDKDGVKIAEKNPPMLGIVKPLDELLKKGFIWTSAMLVKSNLLKDFEKFDPTFKKNQEWDLTIRLSKITNFYIMPEKLVRINLLGDNQHLGGRGNNKNIIIGLKQFIDKHMDLYIERPKYLAFRYFQLGQLYIEEKERGLALKFFFKAFFCSPSLFYFKQILLFFIKKHEQN